MFKRCLATLLSAAICALSLFSCGNVQTRTEVTSQTTEEIKTTDEFRVAIACGEESVVPVLSLSSTDLPEKSAARAPEKSFDEIKNSLPVISCASLEELHILVNGKEYSAHINLLDESGKECAYKGKGGYYAVVSLRFHGNTFLENGELFKETSYYSAYFRVDIEPSGADIVYSTAEPYLVSKESDYKGEVRGYYYSSQNLGMKILTGDIAEAFAVKLASLSSAGGVIPAVCGEDNGGSFTELPADLEDGLIWFECEGKIYRISSRDMTVCLAQTYYGEGEALYADIEFWNMLTAVNYYSPYTDSFYYGEYRGGRLEISHIYDSGTKVDIKIKLLTIVGQPGEKSKSNEITLEITAEEDTTLTAEALTKISSDQYGSNDRKELTLTAGVPQTVNLQYACIYGSDFTMEITIDNTEIYLEFFFTFD